MWLTIAVLLVVAAALLAACIDAWRTISRMQEQHERSHNEQLTRHLTFQHSQQEDIRALTHSLCRTNQVPYIPPNPGKRELEHSPGWFDKKAPPPILSVTEKGKV